MSNVYMPPLMDMDTDGMVNLIIGIINYASDEYVRAVNDLGTYSNDFRYISKMQHVAELERFFRSKWFNTLTRDKIDQEDFIKRLQDKAHDKKKLDKKEIKHGGSNDSGSSSRRTRTIFGW